MNMIPFKVDPSWYERYWWCDPAPDRTVCRAYKGNRERLLRAADAMNVAIIPFIRIVLAALRLRRRGDYAVQLLWTVDTRAAKANTCTMRKENVDG